MSCLINVGLCVESVNSAYAMCEELFEKLGLGNELDGLDEMWRGVLWQTNIFKSNNPTTGCIETLFEAVMLIIKKKYPNLSVTYFPQWSEIDTEIDDLLDQLHEKNISSEIIKEILKNRLFDELEEKYLSELAKNDKAFFNFLNIFKAKEDFVFYKNTEELGADHKDNGCREESDTDEAFGEFLLQAYKDGQSDTIYFQFKDGTILAGVK